MPFIWNTFLKFTAPRLQCHNYLVLSYRKKCSRLRFSNQKSRFLYKIFLLFLKSKNIPLEILILNVNAFTQLIFLAYDLLWQIINSFKILKTHQNTVIFLLFKSILSVRGLGCSDFHCWRVATLQSWNAIIHLTKRFNINSEDGCENLL